MHKNANEIKFNSKPLNRYDGWTDYLVPAEPKKPLRRRVLAGAAAVAATVGLTYLAVNQGGHDINNHDKNARPSVEQEAPLAPDTEPGQPIVVPSTEKGLDEPSEDQLPAYRQPEFHQPGQQGGYTEGDAFGS